MGKPQVIEEVAAPTEEEISVRANQLPEPVGFRILCAVPKIEAKFDGTALVRPETIIDQERFATVVLFVVKLGKDCYMDKTRYPSGPWCKKGDFVLVRQYSGTRFSIYGKEFRMIFEDMVEGTVQDPRGLSRA